jgi:TetR/AcrR family transcriptional repressor of nem operon
MTVGRPAEFEHDAVLDTAMELFWQRGYEATSLADLLDVMGLSRSSFYRSFKSKHELFLCCLDRYRVKTTADLRQRLDRAASGRDFIEEALYWAIEEVVESADPRGCLIMNTATEFAQRDGPISRAVADGLDDYRAIFLEAIERGRAEGSIEPPQDDRLMANYLVTTMSGLRTMVKAGTDGATLNGMVAVVTNSL